MLSVFILSIPFYSFITLNVVSINMSAIIPSFIILSVVVPAPDLTHKYNTWLKKLAMDLHSSCFVLSREY